MRTFKHFPEDLICPICDTNNDKECCLIPIDGTADGNICEAQPVHVDCVTDFSKFRYHRELKIIYCPRNTQSVIRDVLQKTTQGLHRSKI